ncbi:MAG TPA: PhzF family phenazine biosynthesis protein [Verrucomicrobiae bacterium]|nr:PhzF family phenazine biosynthesis protein [Verrucomicrobiae bacterium]
MAELRYHLFDVFTETAFEGNPLAVFAAADLGDDAMQRVAGELNLSETVFLRRGEGEIAASLRIFTPRREVEFAGHPTVGSALAIAGVLGWMPPQKRSFVLRERAGDIPVSIDEVPGGSPIAWLRTPPVGFGATVSREQAAAVLRLQPQALLDDLPPQFLSAGNPFLYVPLRDAEAVDRAAYDAGAAAAVAAIDEAVGVYLFALTERGAYARMFAPRAGVAEDPATGSATGPLYAYLARYGALREGERFLNEQGVAMGRRSHLHVRLTRGEKRVSAIEIGGQAVLVGEGVLRAEFS